MESRATTAVRPARLFPLRLRHTLLTAHIAISVGLLGDSAGFLAVAVRAAGTDDPAAAIELAKVLNSSASRSGSR